ncbi:hypothetical protein [Paraburkholderia hiiakae]|uniref:hypothetical protein n=1 Tax=Paraburkholderia hiiakae TaxID=1081782 RepID=UPI00191B5778|nr:hypothetical protein [Paraburkholderia hiiakae]
MMFFVLRIIYDVLHEISAAIISKWERAKCPAGTVTLLARAGSLGAIVDQGAEAGAAALAA